MTHHCDSGPQRRDHEYGGSNLVTVSTTMHHMSVHICLINEHIHIHHTAQFGPFSLEPHAVKFKQSSRPDAILACKCMV